jgi:hypothetical protein
VPRRVDVLIVGAGFMGRWLARFLAGAHTGSSAGGSAAPPTVLVVERDRFAYGASSRNAGFLTCGHVSEMLADIETVGDDAVVESFLRRRRGMAVVRREVPDLPVDACGSVDFDPLTEAGMELARKLNAAGGEEVFSLRHVQGLPGAGPDGDGGTGSGSQASTGGAPARGRRRALFNAADGGVDPVRLLRLLRVRSRARFAFGVDAREVSRGVARLRTPMGDGEVHYGHAFVCTNGFTASLHPDSPIRPGRGQVIVTTPVPSSRPDPDECTLGYLNRGYDYFRWLDDRLLVGGGRHRFGADEDGTTALTATPALRSYLEGVARRILGHDDFGVEAHWAGIMGFPHGHHVGGAPRHPIDDVTEAVAGFGGMGVALTPAVAEEIAASFLEGGR